MYARLLLHRFRKFPDVSNSRYSSGLAAVYSKYGNPPSVLELTKVPVVEPKQGEVRVKMLAASINPADINTVQGKYNLSLVNPEWATEVPAVGGYEGCGIIDAVGDGVVDLKTGDKVVFGRPGSGTWQTHVTTNRSVVCKIPQDTPIELAATVCVNPCTAMRMLDDFVVLRKGDTIIQNAANSGVGKAVIQFAKLRNIETINVIRDHPNSEARANHLKELGATVVLLDSELRAADTRKLLKGRNIPLALNGVCGDNARDVSRYLSPHGVMVTYGGMSMKPIPVTASSLIFQDITYRGFWLTRWLNEHPSDARTKMILDCIRLSKAGNFVVDVHKFDFNDFQSGIEEAMKFERKILITFE
eukprot:Rmarinus@m.1149